MPPMACELQMVSRFIKEIAKSKSNSQIFKSVYSFVFSSNTCKTRASVHVDNPLDHLTIDVSKGL